MSLDPYTLLGLTGVYQPNDEPIEITVVGFVGTDPRDECPYFLVDRGGWWHVMSFGNLCLHTKFHPRGQEQR